MFYKKKIIKMEIDIKKIKETQFWKDMASPINFDGKEISRAYYNLCISIRDIKLYKAGMKPNRYWKISDVKEYFGVRGSKDKILDLLEEIKHYFHVLDLVKKRQ